MRVRISFVTKFFYYYVMIMSEPNKEGFEISFVASQCTLHFSKLYFGSKFFVEYLLKMNNIIYPDHLNYQIPKINSNSLETSSNKFKEIKKRADEAIREAKIFMIIGYFPIVRIELIKRGWVEKHSSPCSSRNIRTPLSAQNSLKLTEDKNEFEYQLLSSLVEGYPADFVFSHSYERAAKFVHDFALFNRIKIHRAKDFTFKDGLCNCLADAHFYTYQGKTDLNVPRSFYISTSNVDDFVNEFELTLCRNFILYLNKNKEKITSDAKTGTYPVDVVNMVCDFLQNQIQSRLEHADIEEIFEPMLLNEQQKQDLNKAYFNVIKMGSIIWVEKENIAVVHERVQKIANDALSLWPHSKDDGYFNIWIVKPVNLCGGNGIQLLNSPDDLQLKINDKPFCGSCIVQKYLERPLLIHRTKFDIRYFFMITIDTNSFKIWEHQSCYLRFSSTEFNLGDFSEQIHLTNHSVQMRYTNCQQNEQLPSYRMWNLKKFQEYLETNEKQKDIWYQNIHPAITRNIVGVVQSSIEEIELKSNRFHIYGADFLITEDFNVYLLEVNCSPALSTNTTPVTEVIFQQVQEDAIKGILPVDLFQYFD